MKKKSSETVGMGELSRFFFYENQKHLNPFQEMFDVRFNYEAIECLTTDCKMTEHLEREFESIRKQCVADPFVESYRTGVRDYYRRFMNEYEPEIKKEIRRLFGRNYPEYMVTVGIGANELFTRFAASINNESESRRLEWFVINSPKDMSSLPKEITTENTIFLEFSRSGVAEETVKIHEYTPRKTKRIIFSNGGPLVDLAARDGNLILPLPPEISGRYGRNKTPILLAPMVVAGMDVEQHWKDIDLAIREFNVYDGKSLPFAIAKYIYISQSMYPPETITCTQNNNGVGQYEKRCPSKNLIYLGCNDNDLGLLGDQFLQFWNEGVNRPGNDLMISRFFGLPRDSHMNIEGILGNHSDKIGIFLLRTNMRERKMHPIVSMVPDVLNPEHKGLHFGDEDVVFAMANYKRLSELMPTILVSIPNKITMAHSAVLGQLFADITFIYSRMVNVDPGDNPEVQSIRENSTRFLSSAAKEIREKDVPIEKAAWELTK